MDGWMIFMGDAPMIGLDPQPGSAPFIDNGIPTDAAGWMETYGIFKHLNEANSSLMDDIENETFFDEDEEDQDYDDPTDFILRVSVTNDGTLSIYDDGAEDPFITYSPTQIFDAFGMKFQQD